MKYLKITNFGEIDPNAFALVGASTKRNSDSKIGMFGTGLNYSIAWMIREGIEFHVFQGEKEIQFTTNEVQMRGQSFSVINVNGMPTSVTTEMGKDWKPWYTLREFYCNAIDESLYEVGEVDEDPIGLQGWTTVYLSTDHLGMKEAVEKRDLYFNSKDPDIKIAGARIWKQNPGTRLIYRKGILIGKLTGKYIFDIDVDECDITESRTMQYEFQITDKIKQAIYGATSEEMVRWFIKNITDSDEANWSWGSSTYNKEGWQKILDGKPVCGIEEGGYYIEEIKKTGAVLLPRSMVVNMVEQGVAAHVAGSKGAHGMKDIEPDPLQAECFRKALLFLSECDYPVDYPIKLVQFRNGYICGLAEDGQIFLGVPALQSVSLCVSTLMEECEHLKTGFHDCTREFQNHLFEMWLAEKKKRFTYVL